LGSQWSSG